MADPGVAVLRVLLVAGDPLARGGLAYLLAGEPGFAVVAQVDALGLAALLAEGGTLAGGDGSAFDADPADGGGPDGQADVVLWDAGADVVGGRGAADSRGLRGADDGAGGLERLGDLGADGPPALVLLPDGEHAAEAMAAGARGLLFRDVAPRRLAAALRAVAAGLSVFDDALFERLARPRGAAPAAMAEPLTPRELEVVQLLAEGLSNRRIGERLGISEHTAKFHVNAIVTKLGAQTRTDAAVRAARLGLVVL